MITFLNKRLLCSTFSSTFQNSVRERLNAQNIHYTLKVSSQATLNRRLYTSLRGKLIAQGSNVKSFHRYTFYVHKKDLQLAQKLLPPKTPYQK